MSLHARPQPAFEIPGLAYFTPLPETPMPAPRVAPPRHPLEVLNQMYAYYSES